MELSPAASRGEKTRTQRAPPWEGGEITLSPRREAGGGVADAAAEPSSDQASRPAVEACVFRTGTALSMSLSCSRLSLARASRFEIARALLRTEAWGGGTLKQVKLGVLEYRHPHHDFVLLTHGVKTRGPRVPVE